MYAGYAHINTGVIASLFSTNIMFTYIIFRVLFGELVYFQNVVVMIVMTAGVVCISLGKPRK